MHWGQTDFKAFVGNSENKTEHLGLFNIISAKLYEIKELEPNDLIDFMAIPCPNVLTTKNVAVITGYNLNSVSK